jgi:diguanylate cyclase (GGDEF)-like protein
MLQLAQQLGDPELQAWAHRGACGAHLLEHQLVKTTDGCSESACAQLELAKRHAAASVELSEVAECVNGVLLGHYLHANVLIRLGDRPGARGKLAEMLNSAGSEARLYRSLALQTRAHIDQLEGDFEESLKSAREALSIDESIGSTRGVMNCCGELADILEAAGDFKGALSWHRRFHSSYKHFASESARAQAAALAIKEDLARSKAMAEAAGARADLLERSNSVLVLEAAHLTRTALEDGLTGVSNRRRFDQELEALVRDHVGRQRCSIALLDVDHFKGVNDRFSHVVGDEVLRQISRIMQRTSRATDIVARYGGEEFAILFVNLAPEEAVLACERVRQSVRDADWSELHPDLRVTVSLGIVHFNERDVDKMSYLKLVDERLYHAKSSGRNRVVGPAQAEGNAITAEPERFRSQMPATVYK